MKLKSNKLVVKYIVAFIICLILIAVVAIPKVYISITGDTVLVKTEAVDPRDLFRGDYVALALGLEMITRDQISEEVYKDINEINKMEESLYEQEIFVLLKENNGIHEVSDVALQKPEAGIYLNAIIVGTYENNDSHELESIQLRYEIDRYFVEENTGKNLEDMIREGNAFAKLKIKNGDALIVEIIEIK